MFDLSMEFMRMGLPTKYWVVTDINRQFSKFAIDFRSNIVTYLRLQSVDY